MKLSVCCLLSLSPVWALAQTAEAPRFVGDIGGMVTTSQAVVNGAKKTTSALPYLYGDMGNFFARVDTLGFKAMPLASGHLELALRVGTEGFKAAKTAHPAADDRSTPMPIGIGTFQRTALGGLFAYAMYEPQSAGQFGEVNWAGQIEAAGGVKIYPQLGLQYRSADYVRHLYGISAAQATATGLSAYRPGASFTPMLSVQASVPLSGPWALQLQTRYRHLDSAIANSPLVSRSSQVSGFAALTYTVK